MIEGILAVIIGGLLYVVYKYSLLVKFWRKEFEEELSSKNIWAARYFALEQGADEQQTSFEQEYLQWDEEKQTLTTSLEANRAHIQVLESEISAHFHHCLPDLEQIRWWGKIAEKSPMVDDEESPVDQR